MRKSDPRRGGFSLIELMISVAIMGILAAIAIPSFQRVQLRSKTSEARTNLAGIRTAEEAYYSEFGTYAGAAATPAALPGSTKVGWPSPNSFDVLGWGPTGTVQFQYAITVPGGGANLVYTAEAVGDLDGDGARSIIGYVKAHPSGGASIAGALGGCPDTGVWDHATGTPTRYNTVGACDSTSGLSVF